jgi:thiamine biosynthesis lipoprotein
MTRCRPALGTYVEISARVPEGDATSAIDAAFAAIATAEACMSVFQPTSDLSRLNAGACFGRPTRVHPWLWDVLALAQRVHAHCPAFDPSVGAALVRDGLRPAPFTSSGQQRERARIGGARGVVTGGATGGVKGGPASGRTGGLDDLWLLDDHQVVTTAPLYLDLGGIAKGAAVDRAVEALRTHGATLGCVNAGGDLRVFGDQAQPIYVRDPSAPHRMTHVGDLQDGALATSGDYRVQHLFHPDSGRPLATPRSFSVMAPRCAVADALTKVYALTGNAQHPALRAFNAYALETVA